LFGEKVRAVEWTISIEGRNEFGGICRREFRIDRSAPEREGGLFSAWDHAAGFMCDPGGGRVSRRKRWTIELERFKLNPIHQMPGSNS
jgi:hypothetical protein